MEECAAKFDVRRSLRQTSVLMLKATNNLPHENVWARIVRSRIHGVGLKAIRDIPHGTYLFQGDDLPMVWVDREIIKHLRSALQRLYDDFAVAKGNRLGCPRSFNLLTPAWYLNHSKRPNVGCDSNYDFYALKDIKRNQELTVNYDEFSESIGALAKLTLE